MASAQITPEFWIKPNQKQFPAWINETFIKYRLTGKAPPPSAKGEFRPLPYQEFARDYMQSASPYRGILLYHGLGSGKTCTSIVIAEELKTTRNIIVLLPAALKDNFIEKGLMYCGDPKYQANPDLISEKYTFISYNAPNFAQQLAEIDLDNHVIIIEEVHNLISMISSGARGQSKQGLEAYQRLLDAKDVKIIALSGTPIVNEPIEVAYIFNILRGYVEAVLFTVEPPAEKKKGWFRQLELDLQLHPAVNFVRVRLKNRTVHVELKVNSWERGFEEVVKSLQETAKKSGATMEVQEVMQYTILPDARKEFNRYFIDTTDELKYRLKNKPMLKRRSMGLVSYYQPKKVGYPAEIGPRMIRVEMSPLQYTEYEAVRRLEREIHQSYRVYSRQLCNFVFPADVPRPGLEGVKGKLRKGAATGQEEGDDLGLGPGAEEKDKVSDKEIQKALDDLSKGSYLKVSELGRYSPKMKAMLLNIEKSPGLVLVYSDFRTLEGIEIFGRILQKNGYEQYSPSASKAKPDRALRYAMYSGEEPMAMRTRILDLFRSPENATGEYIKVLLITRAGAEGLDGKNIRQVHIMEPYWNEVRIEQVIGRAVRRGSHADLPEKDRNVEVFRYFSVLPKDEEQSAKEKLTTDEYLYKLARAKKIVTDEIIDVMREVSVDCTLNLLDQDNPPKCLNFGGEEGLAYLASIREDQVWESEGDGADRADRAEVVSDTKVLEPAGILADGRVVVADPKLREYFLATDKLRRSPLGKKLNILRALVIDPNTMIAYDFELANKEGKLVEVGRVSEQSEFVRS